MGKGEESGESGDTGRGLGVARGGERKGWRGWGRRVKRDTGRGWGDTRGGERRGWGHW